ncbi:MAG TPA: ABC transporter permease [Candidatus Limnocylindrales bacterium]|nr:ABC transporter permease [Candidatus Limnocylindrales bacterium]
MSAPAIPAAPLAAGREMPRGRRPARDRSGVLVEIWLRGHTWLVYGFLYLPILVVVVFSFNASTRVTNWTGFSLHWYEFVLASKEIQRNLINSLIVGVATATVSTIVGTIAALGIQRAPKWFKLPFDALTYVSLIVPEIVIALSTLVFFAVTIGRGGLLSNLTGGPEIGLGYHTIVGALSVFNISLVLLLVQARLSNMDRTHVEASFDLYGTPWRTFWQITFPQLLPAIVAGYLLSFTFAFDDYIITSFVHGTNQTTIPLYVFGALRKGVNPSTNAVAALMLFVTLAILVVGQFLLSRQARKSGAAGPAGVAGMIVEQQGG